MGDKVRTLYEHKHTLAGCEEDAYLKIVFTTTNCLNKNLREHETRLKENKTFGKLFNNRVGELPTPKGYMRILPAQRKPEQFTCKYLFIKQIRISLLDILTQLRLQVTRHRLNKYPTIDT